MFWNVYGFDKNFPSIAEEINDTDIVCLCETWLVYKICYLNKKKRDFSVIQAEAKKCEGRGRPSGGLIVAYNEKIFKKLNEKITDDYIILQLESIKSGKKLCVCNCYARSKIKINEYWEKFEGDMKVHSDKSDCPLIIVGDFNSRIGTLNSYNEVVHMGCLINERKTMDKERDKRGKEFIENIEDMELLVLNGRTSSDTPANFTYLEEKGMSVIDLAMCRYKDINIIEDFRTMNIVSGSDLGCDSSHD